MAKEDTAGKTFLFEGGGVYTYPCTVRDRRSTMTDDEFWGDVSDMLGINTTPEQLQEALELDECFGISAPNPCPECGASVACGYDSEGRPMIHVVEEKDE